MDSVLITGSSRGIGFGIARAFAENGGYRVVLNGATDKNRLDEAEKELKSEFKNVEVQSVFADFSDYSKTAKAFDNIGDIGVLVNNAGVSHFGLFSDMAVNEIDNIIKNNLYTAINTSHLIVPGMVKAKAGCIINITSVWGVTGASCEVAYSAAKAGVIGLTKSLAKELAPSGIRVNAIACGAFETRMNERLTQEEKNIFTDNIPMGRFGYPKEAGDLAVFLASKKADYLTGQVIPLDGGLI